MPSHDDETRASARPRPAPEALPTAYRLRITRSPDMQAVGRTFPLRAIEVRLGRDVQNAIALNDADVSRYHAILVAELHGYRIRDLCSTNGTMVNGSRIQSDFLLHPGDLILVGSTVLAFERNA